MAPQQYATGYQPPGTRGTPGLLSLLQTDQRQQLETVYLETYLPSGETPQDTIFTKSVLATWVPTIRYLASTDSVVRLAFDSCILMALGQQQSNLDFTHHGMALYCQALTKTNRALQDAATAQTDVTLATCEVLAMCERYRLHAGSEVSTRATDYQRHVQGTAKLLELRGSHRHIDDHGFALFDTARSVIALSGITHRRRAYLDTTQWFEVPWGARLRQRTLKDKMVDVMLSVAAMLEQLDLCCNELDSEHPPSVELLQNYMGRCIAPVQRLRAWEIEALRVSASVSLEDLCASHGFGMFHLIMEHWAVFLLLSARCWPILNRVNEPTAALQALTALLPDPQRYAVKISNQAYRYFLPATGLVGPQYASFPLGAALHFFSARTRQTAAGDGKSGENEAGNAMNRIHSLFRTVERAKSTAEFLRSMAPDTAPQNLKGDVKNAEERERMAREWFKL